MTSLHAIVYVSSAVRPMQPGDLDDLLASARQRNFAGQVTGVLLHARASFLQYIEGPPETLLPIYASIGADPRHTALTELINAPVPYREFVDWSMASGATDWPTFLQLESASWQIDASAHSGAALSPGRALLRAVWKSLQAVR